MINALYELMHDGVGHDDNPPGRGSGRYGWGTGNNPFQRARSFLQVVEVLRNQGLSEEDIAKGCNFDSVEEFHKAYNARFKQSMHPRDYVDYVNNARANGTSDKDIAYNLGYDSVADLKSEFNRVTTIREKLTEETPRNKEFYDAVRELKKTYGYSDAELANAMDDESTNRFKARYSIAANNRKLDLLAENIRLRDEEGITNRSERARILGEKESTLRNWEKGNVAGESEIIFNTAEQLKSFLNDNKYVDVGKGVAACLGISNNRLDVALEVLKDEGYEILNIQTKNPGSHDDRTTTSKTLAPPGTTWAEVQNNQHDIGTIGSYSEDGGYTFEKLEKPRSVDSKRVYIRYDDDKDSGSLQDGMIMLRRGVSDISLGGADLAQVRINVDDKFYLKGMAVYSDDIPEGYDILFNSNKARGTDIADVLKPLKKEGKHKDEDLDAPVDWRNPFGAAIRQRHYEDPETGESKLSAINIVNEEGDWDKWSKNLPSQMLSKQSPEVIKKQLDTTYSIKEKEFDDLMELTHPAVQKKLLNDYAEALDRSAVNLKATKFPGQTTKVLIGSRTLDDNHIYCPSLDNGTTVALIRFPHGGVFEIPQLIVNNKNAECKKMLGNAVDAVAINATTASTLSGADFDGDTALVIPIKDNSGNTLVNLKTRKTPGYDATPFDELIGFNTKIYKLPKEVPDKDPRRMTKKQRGDEMGRATNLIADIQLAGAKPDEIVRAVKYSMVVIDAYKHKLDYKKAYDDYKIKELIQTYRGSSSKGASSLITSAKTPVTLPYRTELKSPSMMTDEEKERYYNGEKIYREDPTKMRSKKVVDKETGEVTWTKVPAKSKVPKIMYYDDAHELISKTHPTLAEEYYARYANKVKALANRVRAAARAIPTYVVDKVAQKKYAKQIASLKQKTLELDKRRPISRKVDRLATALVKQWKEDNPDHDEDDEKKYKRVATNVARERLGVGKTDKLEITPDEWEAIQARAIPASTLNDLLTRADMDTVRGYAMPRSTPVMSIGDIQRAKSMLSGGATTAEVASVLGISESTLRNNVDVKAVRHSALDESLRPVRFL